MSLLSANYCRLLRTNIFFPLTQVIRFKKSRAYKYQKYGKTDATDLTLSHFDDFYMKVYNDRWQSIRLGLLSPSKYAAMINCFGARDSEEIQIEMRQEGAFNLSYIYEKNMRRILKHLEKKRYLVERRKAEEANNSTVSSSSEILSPGPQFESVSSDSEFESIDAFFTDSSDGENIGEEDRFINAATTDLNLNDFVPSSEMRIDEEEIDDREYYEFYQVNSETPPNVNIIEQNVLNYPTMLNLYTFPRNDYSTFCTPALRKNFNVFEYYLFDLASALPPLVLDISPGDYVADFCAAPGGKSLLMYLTLTRDTRFFLNEISASRFRRLRNVFDSFIPASAQQRSIEFSNHDANELKRIDTFDKILVDVPCTNDRHSLFVADNNIFSKSRIAERVALPTRQMQLLISALRAVKPGGTVVYSTCSLSPIQNDGVVHMALQQLAADRPEHRFTIVDLRNALRPFRGIFRFDASRRSKYGTQVLPFLPSNFGPMYFAKIVRTN